LFLNSALDADDWPASSPATLPAEREAQIHTAYEAGGALGPVWSRWRNNISPLTENET